MARLVQGITALLTETATHEGAATIDLSGEDPLVHLVFTKGAALFTKTYYRSQADEIFAYSKALLAAERHEDGFGWKFGAYMRDPKRGKGNRIQGTVAPALLSAAFPTSEYTQEYVYKCLRYRADDLPIFVAHFDNLFLGAVPEAARRGMARAANDLDEYQLLKYSTRQYRLNRRRKGRGRASVRLVDALGLAKKYLNAEKLAIYEYLHAPTRLKDNFAQQLKLAPHRRRFFKGGTADDAQQGRVSIQQALSAGGSTQHTWKIIFGTRGLFPDIAFKQYIRSMHEAGISIKTLITEAKKRKFSGLWPHQIYAGYYTTKVGIKRFGRKGVCFEKKPCTEVGPVFDAIMSRVSAKLLPPGLNLGIADISGSMFGVPLGGEHSSVMVGHAAVLFASMMSSDLGYAATFSDDIQIMNRKGSESDLQFADRIHAEGSGWGSTQVAGSVVSLILYLLKNKHVARPRTLYFFSDMQFHPPELHTVPTQITKQSEEIRKYFNAPTPPLLSAIRAYRYLLGPVDIVLWNMASYDNAPVPSTMENVLMLSGFDANTFANVTKWQKGELTLAVPADADSGAGRSAAQKIAKGKSKGVGQTAKSNQVELDLIRTF